MPSLDGFGFFGGGVWCNELWFLSHASPTDERRSAFDELPQSRSTSCLSFVLPSTPTDQKVSAHPAVASENNRFRAARCNFDSACEAEEFRLDLALQPLW